MSFQDHTLRLFITFPTRIEIFGLLLLLRQHRRIPMFFEPTGWRQRNVVIDLSTLQILLF